MILNTSTCSTCGYSWPVGTDGSHSCSGHLLRKIEILEARHIALDIERRAYIAEIESLEAKCNRLEEELKHQPPAVTGYGLHGTGPAIRES